MRSKFIVVLSFLVGAALACSAPGAPDTATPGVVTVVVTSDGAGSPQPTVVTGVPQGVSCAVQQDVRVHSCIGVSQASVVGAAPAGGTFSPTKWDGSNWFYGQVPTTTGPTWGWVSRLNSDGSTLLNCTGDTSALPKSFEPCPTAIPPTATWTPIPPTDTPMPTATSTEKPTSTPKPTADPALCGNGVADPGEGCGEPGLSCTGPVFKVCQACKCTAPIVVSPN